MLSKREWRIAALVALAGGIFLLDRVVLTPWLDAREQWAVRRETLSTELEQARRLLAESRRADRHFRALHAASLAADASSMESRILNDFGSWSRDAQLNLSSVRPDRASQNHGVHEIAFQAGGEGSMRSVVVFLHRLESADSPLRVRELQIAARTEGVDDLAVQLRVSTLWDQRHPDAPGQGADSGEGNRP